MTSANFNFLRPNVGFRAGRTGTHNTRSIMVQDLEVVLEALSPEASKEEFREAVVEQNLLGKRTASSRKCGFQRLAELYALDPEVPVFRLLTHFWGIDDGSGRPVLAMLCVGAVSGLTGAGRRAREHQCEEEGWSVHGEWGMDSPSTRRIDSQRAGFFLEIPSRRRFGAEAAPTPSPKRAQRAPS